MMDAIYDIELTLGKLELLARVFSYIPERPAPQTQNPDDPRYSDPGDDEVCEYTLFVITPKGEIQLGYTDPLHIYIYNLLDEEVRNWVRLEYSLDIHVDRINKSTREIHRRG
jgi:hypothetical protein